MCFCDTEEPPHTMGVGTVQFSIPGILFGRGIRGSTSLAYFGEIQWITDTVFLLGGGGSTVCSTRLLIGTHVHRRVLSVIFTKDIDENSADANPEDRAKTATLSCSLKGGGEHKPNPGEVPIPVLIWYGMFWRVERTQISKEGWMPRQREQSATTEWTMWS